MRNIFLTALLALSLSACAEGVAIHGNVIKQSQIETLKVGISTKRDVLQTLGTPSTEATFDKNRWYYVSEHVTTKPMDISVLNEREIVIVDFDTNQKVSSIQFKNKSDGRYVEQSNRKTATQGEQLGVLEQMIENIGKGL